MPGEKQCNAGGSRRDDNMIAGKTQNLGSRKSKKRQSANPLRLDVMLCLRDDRLVAMVHPHAGRRRLRYPGVLKVLGEFVSVAVAADREGQGKKGQNVGMKELPYEGRNS